jgi:hypothetical protein
VAGELGTLFVVFSMGVAAGPLAEAASAVVDVGGFDMLVEGFRGSEDFEADAAWGVFPSADAIASYVG